LLKRKEVENAENMEIMNEMDKRIKADIEKIDGYE
jgi:hypothetical protein